MYVGIEVEKMTLKEIRMQFLRNKNISFDYYPPQPDGHCSWVCYECDGDSPSFKSFPSFIRHLQKAHGFKKDPCF